MATICKYSFPRWMRSFPVGSVRTLATYQEFRSNWMERGREMPLAKRRWGEKVQASTLTEEEKDRLEKVEVPSNLLLDDRSILFDFKRERELSLLRNVNPLVQENFVVPVYDLSSPASDDMASKSIQLDPQLFGLPPREDILHDVCRWQRAKWRVGASKAKTRSEVVGTGKKLRRQKGLGMARMSDGKAPHFVGGGVAHGPRGNKDWEFKMNKKVLAFAMKVALSTKFREGLLRIIDNTDLPSHRTKELATMWQSHNWLKDGHGYFIGPNSLQENFKLAANNLPYLKAVPLNQGTVYDIVNHKYLYLTPQSVECLQDKLLVSMMKL